MTPPRPRSRNSAGWTPAISAGALPTLFDITDRKRDMIVSGGSTIFPFEVESALMEHASVQDCAVIGAPDEKWGEAVKGCVQLKSGSTSAPRS